MALHKKSLNMPQGKSEAVFGRTHNSMAKIKVKQ